MKIIRVLLLFVFLMSGLLAQSSGWGQKSSMPTQVTGKYVRDGGALVSIGNFLYAFRGYRSNEFYLYSLNADQWTLIESIPFGWNYGTTPPTINRKRVDQGGAFCFDGVNTIYATKGGGTKEFWVYDISLDTWSAKAFVPSERGLRGGTSLAYYDGKIYLLAGEQSNDALTNFFEYNPLADTFGGSPWRSLYPIPLIPDNRTFQDGSCLGQLNGIIYALKGSGKNNYFWAYVIGADFWTQMESIPLIHPHNQTSDEVDLVISLERARKSRVKQGGAMTTDGDVIYAIKGGGAQDFWKYSPTTNHWNALETIPRLNRQSVPKNGAALSYTNGMVYLLKGNNTPEFWCYIPLASISNINTQTENSKLNTNPNLFITKSSMNYTVSLSGRLGLSIILATLLPAFPFLKYTLYVEACPTICPPIAVVGSPNNWAGLAITWFVM